MLVRHLAIVPERLTREHKEQVARDLSRAMAAFQTQVTRDLRPLWHVDATVTAFASIDDVPLGHWVIFLKESIGGDDQLGFHLDSHNQPYALVAYDDSWTLSLSHEILEILVDPSGNRLVAGPSVDPKHPHHRVRYLLELCDPCEDSAYSYTIDGIVVSDFITPHYHDPQDTSGARYSFTGAIGAPREVLPGGYLTWEDPVLGEWYQLNVVQRRAIKKLGPIENARSLRAHVNRLTPLPAAVYHANSAKMKTASRRRAACEQASAAQARSLRSLVR
ncbi:MAG: hypothetical protein QOF71_931 [Candidatus Eremiobacteraeota bacterium]|jgi:hypothetical protein|nr:hypothetical protein [Candidatus Eremiobacteraeota bacterium]